MGTNNTCRTNYLNLGQPIELTQMGQLIPLKLQSSLVDIRQAPPSAPPTRPLPAIPHTSKNFLKREMFSSELPHTGKEWRQALDEVRAMYVKRQHRQCSSRCIQLLEDATDSLLPLHSIYLSFYAATCLELTARPMLSSSPQKLCLLELAKVNFQRAEYFLCEAKLKQLQISEEHMTTEPLKAHQRFTSSASETSSTSCLSSIMSVRDSCSSTRCSSPMHSPASSVTSFSSNFQEEHYNSFKPRPLRVKKKVSFSLTLPTVISELNISTYNNELALKPPSPRTPTSLPEYSATDVILTHAIDHSKPDTVSQFLLSRSIARYNAHLSSLATQLTYHISVLEKLISELQLSSKSTKPAIINVVRVDEKVFPALSISDVDAERTARTRRRQARIMELKRRGEEWKSGNGRRFDAKRIEILCEGVLRELGES